MTDSLNGLTDDELIKRAVAGARSRYARKGQWHMRWTAVMDCFGLGRTYAQQLCLRFGINPDEKVKK